MRPLTFARDQAEQWSQLVLSHGLPVLPHGLGVHESVPVSYWIGPTTAAVLHIRFQAARDGRPEAETDVHLFSGTGTDWELSGSGGGGWPSEAPLDQLDLPPSHVDLHGMTSGGGCTAVWGDVGTGAVLAEVEKEGSITRRSVQAPIGAFVACAASSAPFTVRVFDSDGALLGEHHEPAFARRPGFATLWRRGGPRSSGPVIAMSVSRTVKQAGDNPAVFP